MGYGMSSQPGSPKGRSTQPGTPNTSQSGGFDPWGASRANAPAGWSGAQSGFNPGISQMQGAVNNLGQGLSNNTQRPGMLSGTAMPTRPDMPISPGMGAAMNPGLGNTAQQLQSAMNSRQTPTMPLQTPMQVSRPVMPQQPMSPRIGMDINPGNLGGSMPGQVVTMPSRTVPTTQGVQMANALRYKNPFGY